MTKRELENLYFDWLYEIMCIDDGYEVHSYRRLFMHLHKIEFTYLIERDENRACDGINLRYRFAINNGFEDIYRKYLTGPCSVLEMIIALAITCEEHIMDDPAKGNRTKQWFWYMISNLGLGGMYDGNFDRRYVDEVIYIFLNREYSPDGRGGLFTIRNCEEDLRNVEIIYQLYWYINSIT